MLDINKTKKYIQKNFKNIFLIVIGIIIIILFGVFLKIKSDVQTYQKKIENKISDIKNANPQIYKSLMNSLKSAQDTLKKDPKNYNAWTDKGIVLQTFGDIDGAEQSYLEAVKVSKLARVPYNNLGSIYMEKKNYSKALEMYENIIKYFPDDTSAYINIFQIYAYRLKDPVKAASFIDYSISTAKGSDIVFTFQRNLAEYYQTINENDKAIKIYQDLALKDPKNKIYYETQIQSLMQQKKAPQS